MPSENPDLDGMLGTDVPGTQPQAEEQQLDARLSQIDASELPSLLHSAIAKFCSLGPAKHLTREAAEVAEFVKLHSAYPLLSNKQIQVGKIGGAEEEDGDEKGETNKGKRNRGPTLLEKQQVREEHGERSTGKRRRVHSFPYSSAVF